MTEPLYYSDPLATEFSAVVIDVLPGQNEIVLDRTLFYPEGGGQPADAGTIGGVAVIDVRKGDDGVVRHRLSSLDAPPTGTVFAPGDTVTGVIDWTHRFEYMQQHTGQHVLSAALYEVAGAGTVSVAQGSEVTSIEIDTDSLGDSTITAVEDRANAVIRENLPVEGFWIDDSELSAYRLRRETSRSGRVRLVRIGAASKPYDLVACGGVHLPRTGMLNLVQTVAVERIRGHQRLHFKIGSRALEDYRRKHRVVTVAAGLFSAQPDQLPERIDQEQREIQELRRLNRIRAERIAELILDEAIAGADKSGGPPDSVSGDIAGRDQSRRTVPHRESTTVTIDLSGEDADIFKAIAETAASRAVARTGPSDAGSGGAVDVREVVDDGAGAEGSEGGTPTNIVITNREGNTLHWAIVIADTESFPADRLRRELLGPFGAKGGGKPPLWRGIVPLTGDTGAMELSRRFARVFRQIIEG
ncbi:MAG: alanyl-tRNA editing protein [Alkalispirochaeta sp.]